MTTILETRELCKRFGRLVVTDHCSLSVADGETHAVIGPNADSVRNLFGDYAYPAHLETLLEQARQGSGWDTGAVIGYAGLDRAVGGSAAGDADYSARLCVLDSVVQQVAEDLFEAVRVAGAQVHDRNGRPICRRRQCPGSPGTPPGLSPGGRGRPCRRYRHHRSPGNLATSPVPAIQRTHHST